MWYAVYYYATAKVALFILRCMQSKVSPAMTRGLRHKLCIMVKMMLCDTL